MSARAVAEMLREMARDGRRGYIPPMKEIENYTLRFCWRRLVVTGRKFVVWQGGRK
jgi:hypothetical protein